MSKPLKTGQEEASKTATKRAAYDRYGKYKYVVKLCNKILEKLEALMVTQQYMIKGLEHEFLFEQEYVEDVACTDEVDYAILEELHYAGLCGILPKDVAARLKQYKLKPWNVTQRIKRVNKKLDHLIGQKAAEKRGKGWALTTFLRQAWGTKKEEIQTNVTEAR